MGEKLLTVDVGNTRIGLGVYGEGRWLARFRIRTVAERTPEEHGALIRQLLEERGLSPGGLSRAILGSVVPPVSKALKELLTGWLGRPPLVVGPGVRTGLNLRVDHPSELGADLVANGVAAHERFKEACIAVDFGTATSFICVDAGGALVGVAIAPGIATAADALAKRTALLPEVTVQAPPRAMGRNTQEAMQSGLIFGYVGLVKELIARLRAELAPGAKAIATGDHAPVIAPLVEEIQEVDPWLTLEGLRLIADRNR